MLDCSLSLGSSVLKGGTETTAVIFVSPLISLGQGSGLGPCQNIEGGETPKFSSSAVCYPGFEAVTAVFKIQIQ